MLPGTPSTYSEGEFQEAWSWLVQLNQGNFACKCCSYVEKQQLSKSMRTNTLSSPMGLTPSKWTRLQSFRQHAQMPHHKKAAILFVRDTMKDIPLQSIPSTSEDFADLLKNIKERKINKFVKSMVNMGFAFNEDFKAIEEVNECIEIKHCVGPMKNTIDGKEINAPDEQ